jgi:hypothetical protein
MAIDRGINEATNNANAWYAFVSIYRLGLDLLRTSILYLIATDWAVIIL